MAGITGVDIVYNRRLPIELKLKGDRASPSQTAKWCRFASAETRVFVALFLYVYMPTEGKNDQLADACWNCWSKKAGGNQCKNKPRHGSGSVYVAAGFMANKGKRIYVADPTPNCNPLD